MMSHPNHERRRNRTFRVEVLESRALLSTAGAVSRPAAVVAPPAPFAQLSSIAGDPVLMGTAIKGKLSSAKAGKVTFKVTGAISGGLGFNGEKATLAGEMNVAAKTAKDVIDYNNGSATLTGMGLYAFTIDNVVARERGVRFEMTGIISGAGFDRSTGTFDAKGTIEKAFLGGYNLDLKITADITSFSAF
jgi:hypothetical protein